MTQLDAALLKGIIYRAVKQNPLPTKIILSSKAYEHLKQNDELDRPSRSRTVGEQTLWGIPLEHHRDKWMREHRAKQLRKNNANIIVIEVET